VRQAIVNEAREVVDDSLTLTQLSAAGRPGTGGYGPVMYDRSHDGWRERIGEAIGATWAPLIGRIARARHARMFHPDGQVFSGSVTAVVSSPFADLAAQLGPHVLARFSGALRRKGRESLDVLGIAMRFSHAPIEGVEPVAGDQDLLFATILSPFTMPLSPFTTRSHDFFANSYYAVAPFVLPDRRRVKFRLVALGHAAEGREAHAGSRATSLSAVVESGGAHFALEARETLHLRWHPIARIAVEREEALDQRELRFDPYQDGAGIVPVGVVQAIRRRAYPASQAHR
jgi:hypothetical protein